MAATFDWMVLRIGQILLLLVEHFGPIHGTIKSTVAAIRIEKLKPLNFNRMPEVKTVPWITHVKLANSPLKGKGLGCGCGKK